MRPCATLTDLKVEYNQNLDVGFTVAISQNGQSVMMNALGRPTKALVSSASVIGEAVRGLFDRGGCTYITEPRGVK